MRKTILFLSLFLIVVSILLNEFSIASLFSFDNEISRIDIKILIYTFQILCFSFGVFLLLKGKSLKDSNINIIHNTIVLGFSISVALIIGELLIRQFFPLPNGYPTGDLLFQADSILGWRFLPNLDTKVNWPFETSVEVKTNTWGFRDSFKQFEDSSFIFIGDSYVSALEVEKELRFTELLKRKTNQPIYNLGVNGFGPVQYFLLTKEILTYCKPKKILYFIYLRNDVYDASGVHDWIHGFKRPIILHDSIVFSSNFLPDSIKEKQHQYLSKKPIRLEDFHIYNHFQKAKQWISSTSLNPPEIALTSIVSDSVTEKSWLSLFDALNRIKNLCNSEQIDYQIVIVPTPVQIQQEWWNQIVQQYKLDLKIHDLFLPQKKIILFFKQNDIPYLDLTDGLLQNFQVEKTPLYFPKNLHWNPKGHEVSSDLLE